MTGKINKHCAGIPDLQRRRFGEVVRNQITDDLVSSICFDVEEHYRCAAWTAGGRTGAPGSAQRSLAGI